MNLKKYKIIPLISFLLVFVPFVAKAEIRITDWNEKVNLTDSGRDSELTIKAQVIGMKSNEYQNGFGIFFGTRDKMTVKSVQIDGANAIYTFQNNSLAIKFPRNKSNGDQLVINVSSSTAYNEIDQYLRREPIYVPAWAVGALANIEVNYPWSLQSATLNRNIREFDRKFVYQGIVPKNGVQEIVKLTNVANAWNVKIKYLVAAKGEVVNMKITLPNYFVNGGQQYSLYDIGSDPQGTIEQGKTQNIFRFKNLKDQNISVRVGAQIFTGANNRTLINKDSKNYLSVSDEDKFLLTPILEAIKQDQSNADLPLYARIGNYVHNYITYDRSFAGKLLSTNQIVSGKKGVCVEYARMYNSLARLAGIPAMMVNGVAYGEYKSFEGHSWNLIYYNGSWMPVDPTWDLMSGIVSSSHIYFYENDGKNNPDFTLEWEALQGKASVSSSQDKDFDIQKVW